jgi:hypothetical protein
MKTINKFLRRENKMKTISKVYLSLLLVTLAFAASPGSAWANLAANTQITNAATLSYNDGASPRTATASVTVTVSLVPAAPTIVAQGPYTTQYAGPATTLTDTFVITAGSNGPDTYNLTAAVVTDVNGTGAGVAVVAPVSIILGASVTVAGSTATIIDVPADGNANSSVNGIEVGDTVVINGEVKTVSAIFDNPNPNGISTITLASALVGGAPAAGVLVEEQKIIQTIVTSGTITTVGTSLVVTDTITATSATTPFPAMTSSAVTNTFTSGLATLSKYVRNVTTANNTVGTTSYVFNGNTYYWKDNSSGAPAVMSKPGETLEYILVAANIGTGSVLSSVITDVVPTTYVSFKMGAYGGAGKDVTYWPDSTVPGTSLIFTAASTNDDPAQYATSTLTVNVGGNPPPSLPAAGGTILTTKTVIVTYQVTVNP